MRRRGRGRRKSYKRRGRGKTIRRFGSVRGGIRL